MEEGKNPQILLCPYVMPGLLNAVLLLVYQKL